MADERHASTYTEHLRHKKRDVFHFGANDNVGCSGSGHIGEGKSALACISLEEGLGNDAWQVHHNNDQVVVTEGAGGVFHRVHASFDSLQPFLKVVSEGQGEGQDGKLVVKSEVFNSFRLSPQ